MFNVIGILKSDTDKENKKGDFQIFATWITVFIQIGDHVLDALSTRASLPLQNRISESQIMEKHVFELWLLYPLYEKVSAIYGYDSVTGYRCGYELSVHAKRTDIVTQHCSLPLCDYAKCK